MDMIPEKAHQNHLFCKTNKFEKYSNSIIYTTKQMAFSANPPLPSILSGGGLKTAEI